MDRNTSFPPLSAFEAADVEHVRVWTSSPVLGLYELLPRHRAASRFGQLALSEDPNALVLERFA